MENNKLKKQLWDIYFTAMGDQHRVDKLYTLFSDVCVKFAEWIKDNCYEFISANETFDDIEKLTKEQWLIIQDDFSKTIINSDQELFDYFIQHIYKTK